jgi:hypothetical protein
MGKFRIDHEYVIVYIVPVETGGTKTGVYEADQGVPALYNSSDEAEAARTELHRFARNCGIDISAWVMRRA